MIDYDGRPRVFNGTPEQAEANYRTHAFGAEGRCWNCDCRPWGLWASWRCGTTPADMIAAGAELPDAGEHQRMFTTGFAVFTAAQELSDSYADNW